MRVFLTKWAVSSGIQIVEATKCNGFPDMIEWRAHGWTHTAHKGEWFDNEADARADAIRRIDRKKASLRKQLKKLDETPINFEDQTA